MNKNARNCETINNLHTIRPAKGTSLASVDQ